MCLERRRRKNSIFIDFYFFLSLLSPHGNFAWDFRFGSGKWPMKLLWYDSPRLDDGFFVVFLLLSIVGQFLNQSYSTGMGHLPMQWLVSNSVVCDPKAKRKQRAGRVSRPTIIKCWQNSGLTRHVHNCFPGKSCRTLGFVCGANKLSFHPWGKEEVKAVAKSFGHGPPPK